MTTKIKILLIATFLFPAAYLCAQLSSPHSQINMNEPESLATFRTIYVYGPDGRFPAIQVEKEFYGSAFAASGILDTGSTETICTAPLPLNLEDIACLITDSFTGKNKEMTGQAEIQVLLDERGKYLSHRIMSMEYTPIVAAVEREINQVVFAPAQVNRKATTCWVNLQFEFSR